MSAGIRRCSAVLWEELDGEVVVFDPRKDRAIHLDARAALLWKRLDGVQDIAALAAEVPAAAGGGAPAERVAADVRTLLANLDQLGLLE